MAATCRFGTGPLADFVAGFGRDFEILVKGGTGHGTAEFTPLYRTLISLTVGGDHRGGPYPWIGLYPWRCRVVGTRDEANLAVFDVATDQVTERVVTGGSRHCIATVIAGEVVFSKVDEIKAQRRPRE